MNFSRSSSTTGRARPAGSARALRAGDGPRTIFFTITEVAQSLRVCPRTVRRWIDSKALPAHQLGRLVRISQADLAAFLAAHRRP
jgi:excisionase family DNA binding protein